MNARLALLLCGLILLGGCSFWDLQAIRSQSPDDPDEVYPDTPLVGNLAVPFGIFPVKVEAVGLVTGLRRTGSDPTPSPQRAVLFGEMQTRGVVSPNAVLASRDTALVLVRGVLPPGIQEGDHFDIEVRIPSNSETTSLRGGYLLQTRLGELAVLDHQIRQGEILGWAEGPIMVDPSADQQGDRVLMGRGRVLGGGVALKSRPLALVLKPEQQSVLNSARIETAVNRRFHTFHKGVKIGVASAKTDEYVRLIVHPTYKNNIERYVDVVRSIALRESESERMVRLPLLEKQLLDPITSARAALQLEAIGRQGVKVLRKGIEQADPEVRFYSAEALAYLDEGGAAEVLAETARQLPAFRVFALTALSAMDDLSAYEQLHDLLQVSSAETRYGAFRALWAMNPDDPLVMGESLGGQFNYHVLDTSGPAMIHVTRSRRPEVVLFGHNQRLRGPLVVEAGNQIMIRGVEADEFVVSRFAVGEPDQKRFVSNRVDDVIRAVVELGGTYPDVVQALQEAKASGGLSSRFEVDALPEAGRTFDRADGDGSKSDDPESSRLLANDSLPGRLAKLGGTSSDEEGDIDRKSAENAPKPSDSQQKPHPVKGFFAKMMGNSSG